MGLVQTGGVDKNNLIIGTMEYTADLIAGGLGTVGHDGDLLAHHGIDQCGFAYIASANESNKTGFVFLHKLLLLETNILR